MRQSNARLIVVAILVVAAPAHADDATAKALFDQGRTLFAEGKYGEACVKLEASYKMKELSGTGGLLGACYEKIGRLASAWSAYRTSAVLAERQGNAERAKASRDKADELAPKLAHVAIDVAALRVTPGAKLTIDGVEQPLAALGDPLPIDAGQHLVEATAVDYRSWKQTIDIQDGEKQKLVVPALAEDPTRRLLVESRLDHERRSEHRRKLMTLGFLGTGGIALAVATTLGVLAKLDWNKARDAGCNSDGRCPTPNGAALVDHAATKADIATYLGGAGLVLVGAGVFVYLTRPKAHSEAELRLVPSAGSAGVSIWGTF